MNWGLMSKGFINGVRHQNLITALNFYMDDIIKIILGFIADILSSHARLAIILSILLILTAIIIFEWLIF
jgi:hypothetical protein